MAAKQTKHVALIVIFRNHFARMWPDRHDPATRQSIRDNIRGQRGFKAKGWEH